MRTVAAAVFALLAGALCAQSAPTIGVTAFNGLPVSIGGTLEVYEGQTLNSLDLEILIGDPQNDAVSISATVTNVAQAVNWSEANFQRPSTATPYIHQVLAPLGQFGTAGTVHAITLTASDGAASTNFFLSFKVIKKPASSGSGGSGCSATLAPGSYALAALAGLPVLAVGRARKTKRERV